MTKPVFEVSDQVRLKLPIQAQKMARGLKCLCSEKMGSVFSQMQRGFLMMGLICILVSCRASLSLGFLTRFGGNPGPGGSKLTSLVHVLLKF